MYRRMMGEPGTLWKRLWRVYRREERAPRRGRRAAGISVGTGCSVDMVAGAGKAQRRKQQEKRRTRPRRRGQRRTQPPRSGFVSNSYVTALITCTHGPSGTSRVWLRACISSLIQANITNIKKECFDFTLLGRSAGFSFPEHHRAIFQMVYNYINPSTHPIH